MPRKRLSQRAWDLIVEATVIVTSTIIASLILVVVFHTG
jgi:hypothetical protein